MTIDDDLLAELIDIAEDGVLYAESWAQQKYDLPNRMAKVRKAMCKHENPTHPLCPACNGSGEGITTNHQCSECRGTGESQSTVCEDCGITMENE